MKSLDNLKVEHIQRQIYINNKLNIVNVYKFEEAMEAYKTRTPRTKIEKIAWRRNYDLLKKLQEDLSAVSRRENSPLQA